MSNTTYIQLPDGTYKKVSYTEKEIAGNLSLVEDAIPMGATGATGSVGKNGIHGLDGLNGLDGTSGTSGSSGVDGKDGLNGVNGLDGLDGRDGLNGTSGSSGVDGRDGLDGLNGTSGSSGLSGTSGISGSSGTSGVNGKDGLPGPMGPIGPAGKDGLIGATGATGATGSIGKTGEKGERGFPGMPGAPGRDGGAYQLRFVDKATTIPAGYEQVAKDLYVIDSLTVEGATKQFMIGSMSISNDALLNIKEDLWIDGSFNAYGIVTFDIPIDIKHYGTWFDSTTQFNATQSNTMRFNTADIQDGVKMVNNSRITFTKSGVYNIQFSAQIDKTDSGSDNIDIWIAKNGTNLDWSNTTVELVGNNTEYVASWNWYVQVVKNDYIEIKWHSDDVDMRILSRPAQTSPSIPAIPSVILTVQQV